MTVTPVSPGSDYSRAGSQGSVGGAGGQTDEYWSLGKLKKAYSDYLATKRDEIEEQKDARRYYHGAQWTDEQMKALRKRKQPIVTYNRIARKIDGIVGMLVRQRQDPKAYPRTPKHEEGAELATYVIRYVMDQQDWNQKDPEAGRDASVDGFGGVELNLVPGDRGDPEIEVDVIEPDGFFYDPRSYRMDFSDARYMGVGKWVDSETATEMFPDKAAEIEGSIDDGTDLSTNSDREAKWFYSDAGKNRLRLVECWYKHRGEWCWSIFTGSQVLMEGKSYLMDEKGKTFCKYLMFAAAIDQDGDRYGFIRNMKSAQNEINQRRSKALHMTNSRRLIMTESAVQDIETARREWARPDGVVIVNPGGEVKPDDQTADLAGQLKFLEDAKNEIENFSFNPALVGQGVSDMSGRAIALQQQAGMAELGPFLSNYRGWKIRVYRAIWNTIQRHWTAERWVRVTDDDGIAQFIQVNGVGIDPQTGMPTVVNAVGSLDVDIIIDEGPDTINTMTETFEMAKALAQAGTMPPQVLLELAPIDTRVKKRVQEMMEQASQQPNPEVQAKQADLAIEKQRMEMQFMSKQQEQAANLQMMQEKGASEAQMKRQAAVDEAELERWKAERQAELERWVAAQKMEIARMTAASNAEIAREKASREPAES